MTYFVYLIGSIKHHKLTTYVGYTDNLKRRVNLHNNGKGAKFTKGRTWKLIYYEIHKTKSDALKREIYLKKNRNLRNSIKNKFR